MTEKELDQLFEKCFLLWLESEYNRTTPTFTEGYQTMDGELKPDHDEEDNFEGVLSIWDTIFIN